MSHDLNETCGCSDVCICNACLKEAIAQWEMVKRGDAVLIEKRDGEWPYIGESGGIWFVGWPENMTEGNTLPEAAAAWNDGGEGRQPARKGL